ncbi:MAG: hypothetical protein M1269_04995 [Chloroflexi bacterium]|nr:hypothetical protein [Chloroflexota bacterium]
MRRASNSLTWVMFGLGLGLACGIAVFAAVNKLRRSKVKDTRIERIEDLSRRADELLARLR